VGKIRDCVDEFVRDCEREEAKSCAGTQVDLFGLFALTPKQNCDFDKYLVIWQNNQMMV
jgi:hypothetical protein